MCLFRHSLIAGCDCPYLALNLNEASFSEEESIHCIFLLLFIDWMSRWSIVSILYTANWISNYTLCCNLWVVKLVWPVDYMELRHVVDNSGNTEEVGSSAGRNWNRSGKINNAFVMESAAQLEPRQTPLKSIQVNSFVLIIITLRNQHSSSCLVTVQWYINFCLCHLGWSLASTSFLLENLSRSQQQLVVWWHSLWYI